jgi:hypothetical protein
MTVQNLLVGTIADQIVWQYNSLPYFPALALAAIRFTNIEIIANDFSCIDSCCLKKENQTTTHKKRPLRIEAAFLSRLNTTGISQLNYNV